MRVALDNWLAPSDYRLTPSVARAGAGAEALDLREDLAHADRARHAATPAASSTCRTRSRSSADDDRRRAPATAVLGDDARRFWSLTWILAVTDWKLRFYGSCLGYLWTLARPFAFFGVIYVVFTEIANIGADIPNYGVCILFSMVLFQFFGEATGGAVTSLVARENLLRKMRFPRLVIPLATVLTALMNLGDDAARGVPVRDRTRASTPTGAGSSSAAARAVLAALATGTGMLLATLFVRYRDVQPIWEVATQILFYASPILYVATMVPGGLPQAYLFNPIAAILTQVRHAVVDPGAPTAAELIGGAGWLLVPLAITALVLRARRLGLQPRGAADRREPLAHALRHAAQRPREQRRAERRVTRASALERTPADATPCTRHASSSARCARACASSRSRVRSITSAISSLALARRSSASRSSRTALRSASSTSASP